jgi:tetratricopeptide (TPR) repeat protein
MLVVENLVALRRKSDLRKYRQNTDCELGSADAVGAERYLKVEPIARAVSALFAGVCPRVCGGGRRRQRGIRCSPCSSRRGARRFDPNPGRLSLGRPMSRADKLIAVDLLFKRLLLKPDDLDAGFRYAELETELGDYEAAIGALERMLYYNPNLPRVKLQLGVLYFQVRFYEMARNYFDTVLNAPDVPPDIRTEVQTYVAAIDKAVAINPRSMPGGPILPRCLRSRMQGHCGRSRPRPDSYTLMRYRT